MSFKAKMRITPLNSTNVTEHWYYRQLCVYVCACVCVCVCVCMHPVPQSHKSCTAVWLIITLSPYPLEETSCSIIHPHTCIMLYDTHTHTHTCYCHYMRWRKLLIRWEHHQMTSGVSHHSDIHRTSRGRKRTDELLRLSWDVRWHWVW